MSDESQKPEQWWVSVHSVKRGPFPDEGSARVVARDAKRSNPNFHVAIIDPHGLAESVDT